jgi:V/A-type H+-transporting ATPase subunit F
MYKFIVVTDPDTAAGFRLAGVDVFEAPDAARAKDVISSLSHKDDVGIIAVNEELLVALDKKFRDRIEKIYRPVIIAIPSGSKAIDKRSYIERLLRNAIGYNVVMRR